MFISCQNTALSTAAILTKSALSQRRLVCVAQSVHHTISQPLSALHSQRAKPATLCSGKLELGAEKVDMLYTNRKIKLAEKTHTLLLNTDRKKMTPANGNASMLSALPGQLASTLVVPFISTWQQARGSQLGIFDFSGRCYEKYCFWWNLKDPLPSFGTGHSK